jgi:hypothetical protein
VAEPRFDPEQLVLVLEQFVVPQRADGDAADFFRQGLRATAP